MRRRHGGYICLEGKYCDGGTTCWIVDPKTSILYNTEQEVMMYVDPDFKTKKAFREAVAAGKEVFFYQPNNIFEVKVPSTGTIFIEGPHGYHRWYAQVELKEGRVVKIK